MRHAPLYQWLSETLRDDISQSIYKPGDTLPTEHELMRRHDVSSTTVWRAVHDLVREGWIYRKAGQDTFVKRDKVEKCLLCLTSFAEEMQSRNIKPEFKLVCAKMLVPPAQVAGAFQVPPQQNVNLIERIQARKLGIPLRAPLFVRRRPSHTHANCLAKISEAKIVAVVDAMRERAQDFAQRTGATAYTDYGAITALPLDELNGRFEQFPTR